MYILLKSNQYYGNSLKCLAQSVLFFKSLELTFMKNATYYIQTHISATAIKWLATLERSVLRDQEHRPHLALPSLQLPEGLQGQAL